MIWAPLPTASSRMRQRLRKPKRKNLPYGDFRLVPEAKGVEDIHCLHFLNFALGHCWAAGRMVPNGSWAALGRVDRMTLLHSATLS